MCEDRAHFGLKDLKYRSLVLKLSRKLSCDEVKYMLKSRIPAGKREKLTTTLQVFDFLENLELVGPNNLCGLIYLLGLMDELKLRDMVVNFLQTGHLSQSRKIYFYSVI